MFQPIMFFLYKKFSGVKIILKTQSWKPFEILMDFCLEKRSYRILKYKWKIEHFCCIEQFFDCH